MLLFRILDHYYTMQCHARGIPPIERIFLLICSRKFLATSGRFFDNFSSIRSAHGDVLLHCLKVALSSDNQSHGPSRRIFLKVINLVNHLVISNCFQQTAALFFHKFRINTPQLLTPPEENLGLRNRFWLYF
jgi:hypothetical protein